MSFEQITIPRFSSKKWRSVIHKDPNILTGLPWTVLKSGETCDISENSIVEIDVEDYNRQVVETETSAVVHGPMKFRSGSQDEYRVVAALSKSERLENIFRSIGMLISIGVSVWVACIWAFHFNDVGKEGKGLGYAPYFLTLVPVASWIFSFVVAIKGNEEYERWKTADGIFDSKPRGL